MNYALIMAGGSGTRLWPMSRNARPKQLIPFIGGKSLLQIAFERLDGLVAVERRYICAGRQHEEAICAAVPGFKRERFLGEPIGRDTLNAIGLGAEVIGHSDPEAVIAVFTADHVIEPPESFREIIAHGFRLAEREANMLVTFGITPTAASTAYGYLHLGHLIDESARVVEQFREKPDLATARTYLDAGAEKYLWNSGMFVWRAATLLGCIRRYVPENSAGFEKIGRAWFTPQKEEVLAAVFPALKKISVDFAVMEPASRDPLVRVAAIPMPLHWLDVGSWPSFGETCAHDEHGIAIGGGRGLALNSRGMLMASSDARHLIAAIGCEDLIIIHTPDATLVCRKDQAESIKELYRLAGERFGQEFL